MKSTQRYQLWLFSDERSNGMSFGEWLRKGLYSPVDEPDICGVCNGSGEGMWDGSTCPVCRGMGVVGYKPCRKECDWED